MSSLYRTFAVRFAAQRPPQAVVSTAVVGAPAAVAAVCDRRCFASSSPPQQCRGSDRAAAAALAVLFRPTTTQHVVAAFESSSARRRPQPRRPTVLAAPFPGRRGETTTTITERRQRLVVQALPNSFSASRDSAHRIEEGWFGGKKPTATHRRRQWYATTHHHYPTPPSTSSSNADGPAAEQSVGVVAATNCLAEVETLHRQIVTVAETFRDRNVGAYFRRRAIEDFQQATQELRQLDDPAIVDKLSKLKNEMQEHLAMLQRQSLVGNMYHVDKVLVQR